MRIENTILMQPLKDNISLSKAGKTKRQRDKDTKRQRDKEMKRQEYNKTKREKTKTKNRV